MSRCASHKVRFSFTAMIMMSCGARGQTPTPPDTIAARVQGCAAWHVSAGEGTQDESCPRIAGKPAGYLFNQLQGFREGRRTYPPLVQNRSIEVECAVNAIRVILSSGYPPQTAGNSRPYGMSSFAQTMSDEDIAVVVAYLGISWGSRGQPVTSSEVNPLRQAPPFD